MMMLKKAKEAENQVKTDKNSGLTIGLVPTMGALHEGHLALVTASKKQCDRTYVSIFVNPTQFNDKKDLEAYPVEIESDLAKLKSLDVDVVFMPAVEEMYPEGYSFPDIDLKGLDHVLEGEMRPGHFEGVAKVVYRFFEILQPDYAYFGQKDFQQTVVVRHFTEQLGIPVKIVVCPTVREPNGLAMSSRNVRMSTEDRNKAGFLYRTLIKLKEDVHHMPLEEALSKARHYLNSLSNVKIEYFAAVNGKTMEIANDLSGDFVVCVTVVNYGGIRMLDNIVLKNEN